VVQKEDNNGTDCSHQKTIEIQASDPDGAKHIKQDAADKCANDAQHNVQYEASASIIYNLAANEPGNQPENYPGQK
jgi:hypothetical protein